MNIIAADSSSAILTENFEPLTIVSAASVLVSPPYREPKVFLAEAVYANAQDGHDAIVHEAELCKELIGKVKADIVHLDISLGAVPLEELSPIQFSNLRISNKAKRNLLRILPKLRKIAGEITQKYGVEVLAIGKESIPVRIAELTAGAHAILYASEKAVKENKALLLGLPSKCRPIITEKRVYLYSLIGAEHDVRGYAEDSGEILKKVVISEMLNPFARGFRALRIKPKT